MAFQGEESRHRQRPGLLPRYLFWSSGHALSPLTSERVFRPALSVCGVSCIVWRIYTKKKKTLTPGRFLSAALSFCGVSYMIWRVNKQRMKADAIAILCSSPPWPPLHAPKGRIPAGRGQGRDHTDGARGVMDLKICCSKHLYPSECRWV